MNILNLINNLSDEEITDAKKLIKKAQFQNADESSRQRKNQEAEAVGGRGGIVGSGEISNINHPAQNLYVCTYTYNTNMATKTISISEEAYEKLKSLKDSETDSFSTVIIRYFPKKKKLSELLAEIGHDPELANSIEGASKEMRKASIREVKL